MIEPLEIDPEIARASTPPAAFYRDPRWLELLRDRVFARSWQLVGDARRLATPGSVEPVVLLPGCLDEPLVLIQDGELRACSNVCTHRGNLVVTAPGVLPQRTMRCGYHGRRFALDGRCVAMPEFEGVVGFPGPSDHLPQVATGRLGPLVFASLDPVCPIEELLAPVRDRVGWMALDALELDPEASRDYLVDANWALYCDNYLEGFHVPFVHADSLAGALDWSAYRTELHRWSSLQLGVAAPGQDAFDLPREAPDHGSAVAAYYFWLFPNTMLNFYPWGLSVNVVEPLGVARTRVRYLTYVADASRRGRGAGAGLDRVEREDEEIVERYRRGRYSPTRETGVHHFHRLVAELTRP